MIVRWMATHLTQQQVVRVRRIAVLCFLALAVLFVVVLVAGLVRG
jgi:hypothetical protein